MPVKAADLSKAIAIRVDVFAPAASVPSSGWQLSFGLHATGEDGTVHTVYTDTWTMLADQWDTFEIPLDKDTAATLASPTALTFGVGGNSGDAFTGPVYFDNLRAAGRAIRESGRSGR